MLSIENLLDMIDEKYGEEICRACKEKYLSPGAMDSGPYGQKIEPDEEVCAGGTPVLSLFWGECAALPGVTKVIEHYLPIFREFEKDIRDITGCDENY